MNWRTLHNFVDSTYHLRVKGYDLVGGNLANPRVLEICDNPGDDNYIVLTVDNRIVATGAGIDANGHPCGPGTVHTCTSEPDVEFLAVKILHAGGGFTDVEACGQFEVSSGDDLQIDFVAHDPDAHLAKYSLSAAWGESNTKSLLALGAPVPSPVPTWAPPATHAGPTYGHALIADPTIRPHWGGGAMRLTVPATVAFEDTCCYQLTLTAHKRTIVNCDESLWGHWNRAETSFMIVLS